MKPFRSPLLIACIAAAILVPQAVLAQAGKGRPPSAGTVPGELWEITLKMDIAGAPMSMPPQTHRMCLGKDAGDEKFVPQNGDCKFTENSRNGDTHRYKMVCTGKDPLTAEGEITHAKDAYTGRMRMTARSEGGTMQMTQTFSGRKVGECTAPSR